MNRSLSTRFSADFRRNFMLPVGLIIITLLLLNQLIPALLGPTSFVAPTADTTQDVVVETVAEETVSDVVVVDSFGTDIPGEGIRLATVGDSFADWQTINGDWQARDGGLYHASRGSFDNFAVYTTAFNPPYAVEAVIDHADGIGGGILIGAQSLDSHAQSVLVRFEGDGSAIYWGTFDENRVFEGRGYADISIDPLEPQRLAVRNLGNAFDLLLNGELLAADIPLEIGSGYVGIAAPDTEATFYDLRIVTPEGVAAVGVEEVEVVTVVESESDKVVVVETGVVADSVVVVPAQTEIVLGEADTINGDWVYADGTLEQILSEQTDYVTGLNVLGGTYRVEATIELSSDPAIDDSGGGFIIHMPDRYQRAGGTMVRLLKGGREVLWGQFDATGTFRGQGNIPLDQPLDGPFKMAVEVRGMQYDIMINNETIVQGLPLPVEEGWLGLIAYRGPITFSDVQLDLDG